MRKKRSFKENQKCHLESSHSRKECMRMTNFTIENNDRRESRNNNKRKYMKKKIPAAVKKSTKAHLMMMMYGIKFFPSRSHSKSLSQKSLPQIITSTTRTNCKKTQV
jgi:hypothetical protein